MEQKVSIIVPVYNVEKYLKRCVDSLIEQSYKNLEIILVDDGSKDNSFSICKEYESKDSRVRIFHKENEGLGLTRNYGIEKSTGEYITFVDSDDYLTLDAVETMVEKAAVTNADVVVANMFYKDKEMKVMMEERLYYGDDIKNIIINHMMGDCGKKKDAFSYTATAKLFKKELFIKNNLRFPSERKLIWEDLAFSVDVYPRCEKVYIFHKAIYYYCFNEGTLTHTYKPNKLNLVMELYHYMGEKIQILNLPIEAQYRLDTNFIGHIRTCIKLEVFYKDKNSYRTAIQNIRKICSRKDVQTLIRSYPKDSFNTLQYIYNFAMEQM